MHLIKKEDQVIRRYIESQLESLPENMMIHLDKELLERLIFIELVTVDGLVLKYPIWTGSFLRKIDLSEISFDDVCWSFKINKLIPDFKTHEKYLIDLSCTNARIDFSKRYPGTNDLIRCNFSSVNLESSNISSIVNMICVDISNTNAKIKLDDITATDCNFSGLDLRSSKISSKSFTGKTKPFIGNTNLSDTGISITAIDEEDKKLLKLMINDKLLEGCYINEDIILDGRLSHITSETKEILNVISKEVSYVKRKQ